VLSRVFFLYFEYTPENREVPILIFFRKICIISQNSEFVAKLARKLHVPLIAMLSELVHRYVQITWFHFL
jgi:hypothetical protein